MPRLTSQFDATSTADDVVEGLDLDLTGTRYLVTGGYAGLGLATSRALASAGASVVVAGHDLHRAGEVASELRALGPGRSEPLELELGRGESIDEAVANLGIVAIDGLVCNAGVMAHPLRRSDEGWEWHMAVNVLGHVRLLWRLLPALRMADGPRRVVFVSSAAHHLAAFDAADPHWYARDYDKWRAYGQSKTADCLAAVAMQRSGLVPGLDAFAVHPGGILTDLQRHLPRREMMDLGWVDEDGMAVADFKSPEQGAATQTWAVVDPALYGAGGRYLEDCAEAEPAPEDGPLVGPRTGVKPYAVDPDRADALWQWCQRELGIDPTLPPG